MSPNGAVELNDLRIGVGSEWAGCTVTVIIDSTDHATVLRKHQLVRHLRVDRTRFYQPTGRRRGGPRKQRQLP